jgi:PAS domain-containing protein
LAVVEFEGNLTKERAFVGLKAAPRPKPSGGEKGHTWYLCLTHQTSPEELQSINEELSTVNQELKHKVEELGKANSDLQNLMASTDIATVFLDRQLRIQRYTPAAVGLFNLIPTDIGRPISDLSHRLEDYFIVTDAQRVLERLTPVKRERRSRDGRWYIAGFCHTALPKILFLAWC